MAKPDRLDIADRSAAARGLGLTATRREVFAHIAGSQQPLTAYQVLDKLQRERGKSVMPPTVYRAINFLVEHGFVHRLESLNAFVACSDIDHRHSSQFVICDKCGRTEELHDEAIATNLRHHAEALGFTVSRQTIELRGLCQACAGAA
jgi:Fur family zinc uptake transcriptional regulator